MGLLGYIGILWPWASIDSPPPSNHMPYPFLSLAFDQSGALSSSKSQQISGLVRNIKHETVIERAKSRPRPCHIPRFRTVLSFKDWRECVLGASPSISLTHAHRALPHTFCILPKGAVLNSHTICTSPFCC